MTWNYRAVKQTVAGEEIYRIYEVYYTDDGGIEGWTAKPICPQGETLDDLVGDLKMMLHDTQKRPVLVMEELRKQFCEGKT